MDWSWFGESIQAKKTSRRKRDNVLGRHLLRNINCPFMVEEGIKMNSDHDDFVRTCDINVQKREFIILFGFRSESYARMLLVEKIEEQRYVIRGMNKKKAVINVTSV